MSMTEENATRVAIVTGAGRGFGLALTRTLCVRRGGSVSVRNEDGAVFSARLPLPAAVR